MGKDLVCGEIPYSGVSSEAQEHLRGEDSPMPFMKTEVQRVHLAEGEEEHEEDKPREGWCQRQEEFIAEGSDKHGEPEGVGIKEFFHCCYLVDIV